MSRSRLPWGQLLIEVLSVVLAVLLALAANEWRQARADARLARTALRDVLAEVERNRQILEQILPGHEAVLEKLEAGEEVSNEEWETDPTKAFLPVILRDSAWRTAVTSQAVLHMDYAVVSVITDLYTFQEAYSGLTRSLMESAFEIDNFDDARQGAQNRAWRFTVRIFVHNEHELLEAYAKAEAELRRALEESG